MNTKTPYPPCDESDLVCIHDVPAIESCHQCVTATDCDCGACDQCYDRATESSSLLRIVKRVTATTLVLLFAALAHAANVGVSGTADDHVVLCGQLPGNDGPCLYTRDAWIVVNGASPVYTTWRYSYIQLRLGERTTTCDMLDGEYDETGWTDDGNDCPKTQYRFTSGTQIMPQSMQVFLPNGSWRMITVYFGDASIGSLWIKTGVVESSLVLDAEGCKGSSPLSASGFVNVGGCP